MNTCFVIQPFDGGKFDKRYADVFEPAINAADLEAYRVDQDPAVDVPIDAIEDGIRKAQICLADITTDNPNVWYELGYAFASGRPVVMVCSNERTSTKYPFDIQHRTITRYLSESPQDFERLKAEITSRLVALLKRGDALRAIQENEQVAPHEGLSQPELAVLATVAGSVTVPEEGVSAYSAKHDVERAGFTSLGFSMGLRRLLAKKFVNTRSAADYNGQDYQEIVVTETGWNWIEQNETSFLLQRPHGKATASNEDIPF